jgi:menaquinone-dependent protoporphyrinogen oxidase
MSMHVLVCGASKHGATEEVAEIIGGALLRAGHTVHLRLPHEVGDVTPFGAAVLGSAVYEGEWLEPMRRLVEDHAVELSAIPVWLFSIGPIGDPPRPAEPPIDGTALRDRIGARDHRTFPGRLIRASLDVTERSIVDELHAQDGDYRPLPEIEAWATEIAAQLTSSIQARGAGARDRE